MGDVRISVQNFLVIGLMALLFIVVAKVVLTKFPVKGLTQVVGSA